MRFMQYKFQCDQMSEGWCLYTDEPGCSYGCPLWTCDHCLSARTPRRKEPCQTCWMKEESENRRTM